MTALDSAGTALAANAINFVDSTGFTIASAANGGLSGLETGIGTLGTATLTAGGKISETGIVTADTLTGSAAGAVSLTNANQVATLGPFDITAGVDSALSFTDARSLTVGLIHSSTSHIGDVTITTTGAGSNLTYRKHRRLCRDRDAEFGGHDQPDRAARSRPTY